jgi:hypothetical protein
MTHRQRVDDESHPVQALRAAAEADEAAGRDRSARAMLGEPSRAREVGRRGGDASMARAIDGLQSEAGNGAVAWLLGGSGTTSLATSHATGSPQVRGARSAVDGEPVVQGFWGDDEDEAAGDVAGSGGGADTATSGEAGTIDSGDGDSDGAAADVAGDTSGVTELGTGAPAANPSWTKVGPPTNTTYSVSGSLRTVATAIAARPEAGSVKVTPGRTLQSWTPDGGTETVLSAQVQVDQEVELPVWSDKSNATRNQQAEWDRFHKAITTHEAGHVGKDKTAFAGVHSKMLKKTEADADKELDAAEAQAKADNKAYDVATNSGLNQGTGINANIDEVTKVP